MTARAWSESSIQIPCAGTAAGAAGELDLPRLGGTATGTALWSWTWRARCFGPSALAERGVALLLQQHLSVQLISLRSFWLMHDHELWSLCLLEPCKRWCAELQTSSAAPALLEREAVPWPVLQSEFCFIRCEIWHWLQEVHVACPDARVWWKHLLSRNPLPLWHGWFRAQPLSDDPLAMTSCHVAQMRRQDISRAPRAGKAAAEVCCDGCCMHRKASAPCSQSSPRNPQGLASSPFAHCDSHLGQSR